MKCHVDIRDQHAVIQPHGKILIGEGDLILRDSIERAAQSGKKFLVLDLAKATYVDSSGLGEIIQAFTTLDARGIQLCLVGVKSRLYNLLDLTQLVVVLPIYDSVEDAVMLQLNAA